MVKYVQCKHCYDDDPTCNYCDGSGYIANRTIKDRLRDILHRVFPCLKGDKDNSQNKNGYKQVPTESTFYDDLFSMMSDMESTSLLDEKDDVMFDNQNELHKVVTDLDTDINSDSEIDDNNKQLTPDSSCLIEEENKLVRKIEIPNNGVSPDTMPDNIRHILDNYNL